jgi:protein-tyrosine kinase
MAKFRDSAAEASVLDSFELRNLTVDQVSKILEHQRNAAVRFGEAAVALGFVTKSDVLFALSQQFHYPYATEERRQLSPELVALNEPFSVRSESFRALRSQLMMRLFVEGEPHRALAVISPDASDGKTYASCNLAVTLAQLGGRTLLVDADMRGPRVHQVFNINNQAGLSSILSGRADKQVIQQVAGIPSLFVLPVGTTPPNPLELVERPAFGLLMRELASKFDHVIVDTPAAVYGADAAAIAAKCGSALVVARKNTAHAESLRELVGSLRGVSVKLAGVVFNEF